MISIVKDFLLPTPLSTSFLLCQTFIDIQSKKIKPTRLTVAEPGSCPTISPSESRSKTHQPFKTNLQRILRIILTHSVPPPPLTISPPNTKKKEENSTSYLLLLPSQTKPKQQPASTCRAYKSEFSKNLLRVKMINRYTTRAQYSRYTRSLALPIHPSRGIHPVRRQKV